MRGNWETAEALVLAPGQQQQLQQQQQSIMEEQHLPLHSPATPAWGGITDRIVKEEPVEDKNDDSGVSPGHYTSNSVSPRSRRSSSTANCSLSPGSATSHDSNVLHCGRFDYSPQSIYKNCDSPMAYGRLHAMEETSHTRVGDHQSMDDVSSSIKLVGDEAEIVQDNLQCPVCPFTTFNRLQFSEHLAGHYASSCETPQFANSLLTDDSSSHQYQDHAMSAMDEDNRASPSQGERSEQESEEADEPGLRVPRVNSQGKVKTFRCKQCNFVAITKLEFWEHSRGHIKAEKLLTCPKCPFVTEYKHHLEYHLRNHFGSKPFKCDKCSYSCVNKSMLNSHLKSHSNVYQYRCANCSYATKYCHSLKLHLRKYKHNPAMVLNADGSPNPLPIIDVYGTRRGPKQKPSNESGKLNEENIDMTNGQAQLSPMNTNLALNPMSAMHALNPNVMSFPYGQLFPGFSIANHYHQLADDATEKHLESLKTNLFAEYAKIMANDRMSIDDQTNNEIVTTVNNNSPKTNESADVTCSTAHDSTSPRASPAAQVVSSEGKSTPLDLSKPEALASSVTPQNESIACETMLSCALSSDGKIRPHSDLLANNNNHSNTNNNNNNNNTRDTPNGVTGSSPRVAGTSRRKGKAVKIDRRIVNDDCNADNDETMEIREANATSNTTSVQNSKETSNSNGNFGASVSNEFTCQYCEIAFGNVVMYTVHMGYHGYKDPYTCNMCGHECDDKLSFFLHIARSKHS